jgi:hypothetical protein
MCASLSLSQLDIGELDLKVLRSLVLAARSKIKTLDKVRGEAKEGEGNQGDI